MSSKKYDIYYVLPPTLFKSRLKYKFSELQLNIANSEPNEREKDSNKQI